MATSRVPDGGAFWRIVNGANFCEIVDGGRCVTDGPGNYGNNERCAVKALRPLFLTAVQYDVEQTHDYVTVNMIPYPGSGPQAVRMNEGARWVWESDSFITDLGFKFCAEAAGTYVRTHVCMICMHVCMYLFVYACVYVCM